MTSRTWKSSLIACALSIVLVDQAEGEPITAVFSPAEEVRGKAQYESSCARCHGMYLQGSEFGPSLRSITFIQHWGGRSVGRLYSMMAATMPPGADGKLPDSGYLNIAAYLLGIYGVRSGRVALSRDVEALDELMIPSQAEMQRYIFGPSGGLALGATLPSWSARPNPLDHLTSVTDAVLENPPDGSWTSWRRTQDDHGYSPLRQIASTNVRNLRVAWSLALPPGPNEATPLAHDGVIFVHAFGDYILALDAATGDQLWSFHRELPRDAAPTVHRNIAMYEDKLYFATSDAHMVAIEARSGEVIWERALSDSTGSAASGGPLVAQGVVMQGLSEGRPGGARIVGLSAKDGAFLWYFNTVAQPGTVHGNSWNGLPVEKRNGASVWTAGSYSAQQRLAYFGTGTAYNTGPLRDRAPIRGTTNDALYTDTTIALEPRSGALVWHYQHLANDQWDLDWAFERQIISLTQSGANRQFVVTGGKIPIYDVLDAASGKYSFSIDLGLQNLLLSINQRTGKKTVNPELLPDKSKQLMVCPHAAGGKSWLPSAYNPNTHILYDSITESCMDIIPMPHAVLSSGVQWMLRPRPGSDGKYGRLQAIDLQARHVQWTVRQRAPITTGVLATAGNLVFAGDLDRYFAAYDASTGATLWKTRLSDIPNSSPISYRAGGRQFIATVVGPGTGQAISFFPLVPEIRPPLITSSTLWVFALPEAD